MQVEYDQNGNRLTERQDRIECPGQVDPLRPHHDGLVRRPEVAQQVSNGKERDGGRRRGEELRGHTRGGGKVLGIEGQRNQTQKRQHQDSNASSAE